MTYTGKLTPRERAERDAKRKHDNMVHKMEERTYPPIYLIMDDYHYPIRAYTTEAEAKDWLGNYFGHDNHGYTVFKIALRS